MVVFMGRGQRDICCGQLRPPQRAFAPRGWDFHKGLGGTRELGRYRGGSPLGVKGRHCDVSPQGCPQHVITQTHRKILGPLSTVGTSRRRAGTRPRLVFPLVLAPLLPACCLTVPTASSSHPPTPPLTGSHLGSLSAAALFLSLTLLCVLSDASPHLPPPPVSLLLSLSSPALPLVSSLHRLSWPPAEDCIAWVEAAGTL